MEVELTSHFIVTATETKEKTMHRWKPPFLLIVMLFACLFVSTVPNDFSSLAAAESVKFETAQAGQSASVIQEAATTKLDAALNTVLVGLAPDVHVPDGAFHIQTSDSSLNATLNSIGVESFAPVFTRSHSSTSPLLANSTVDLQGIYRLRLQPHVDVRHVIALLEMQPSVIFAEPDYVAHIIATPNDTRFNQQWGLTKINAPAAWNMVTGSEEVVVAVIDSGIDLNHPDLVTQLWRNPGEIAGNGIDDDNNGHIDDIHGWNIVDDNNMLDDNTGHGTQIAGEIAAATNNGQGVAGVCWNCRLMVVKVVQSGGIANYSDIAAGIAYAVEKGAEVINLSLGGYSQSATLQTAVAAASETAVVVAGAGNDNTNNPFYPAAYQEYALAVAGTSSTDSKVATSNYGAWIDVTAPGESIMTTFDGGDYGSTSGTSVAAPFASGLAGLLRSQHPEWSADTIRAHIIQSTDNIDVQNPGYVGMLGAGRIDAGAAVTTAARPALVYQSHTIDDQPNGQPEPGSTVDLDVTLTNNWADASGVAASLSTADPYVTILSSSATYGDVDTYESAANAAPFRFRVSGSAPYAHDIAFTLRLTAANNYSVNVPITISTAPGITYVHGTLTTQTWTNDRTYVVDNHVGIPDGETLTIEAGTEVRFTGNFNISVLGTLVAQGTAAQPIRFTSDPGIYWDRILFLDSSQNAILDQSDSYVSGSIISHAIMENGKGISLNNAAPLLEYIDFDYVSYGDWGIVGSVDDDLYVRDSHLHNGGINVGGLDLFIMRNQVNAGVLSLTGAGIVTENEVDNAPTTALLARGTFTVTLNRIVESSLGIVVSSNSSVSGNLIANNSEDGLSVSEGAPDIFNNTIVFNGNGVKIQSGTPTLHQNNIVPGTGQNALWNETANGIDATGNWWGTGNGASIEAVIYHGSDEFGLGVVDYSSYLSAPEQDAPAYLQNLTLTPSSPVGIETVTFDLFFSRAMDMRVDPVVTFQSWTDYDAGNSPLPDKIFNAIEIDAQGVKWIAHNEGVISFDGSHWEVYDGTDLGISHPSIFSIAEDPDGSKWFGTGYGPVLHFDGVDWTSYTPSSYTTVKTIAIDIDGSKWFGGNDGGIVHFDGVNWVDYDESVTGVPLHSTVFEIAVDPAGVKWFATHEGLVRFNGSTWKTFDSSNSDLPTDSIRGVAIDLDGSVWLGTLFGVVHYADASWTIYDMFNSPLPHDSVETVFVDSDGIKWFGTMDGLARFDGSTWTIYDTANSGLPSNVIRAITVDSSGNKWFLTNNVMSGSVTRLWDGQGQATPYNDRWLDDTHWQVAYDVTSRNPRGFYTITVTDAWDDSDMMMSADTRFDFTIDYAGEITDWTAPSSPWVNAGGVEGDASTVKITWGSIDPDSQITGYRYAIGSAAGAGDIVSWTNTNSTSISRSGLGLTDGQQYWVAVQARNEGGLWSESGYKSFVAGKPADNIIFLPIILRQ